MSRIYYPVRDLCEILSRPRYFTDRQYNETIARVFRNCLTKKTYCGPTTINDSLCLRILEKYKASLIKHIRNNDLVNDYVDEAVQVIITEDEEKEKLRYDCVTALNRLQGILKENWLIARYPIMKNESMASKDFEENFTVRGKFDAITKRGYAVEIKNRAKKMYTSIPRNEYLQCQFYILLTNKYKMRLIQALQGQSQFTFVYKDSQTITEIIDNVVALSNVFRRCIDDKIIPDLSMIPEFNWTVPFFAFASWQ